MLLNLTKTNLNLIKLTTNSLSKSVRSIGSISSPNHPSSCLCARCSSSPVSYPSTISRPSTSTGGSNNLNKQQIRSVSRISSPNHPTTCLCARCSSSPIGFTPPTRPSTSIPTVSIGVNNSTTRGMKVRSAIKKYCDGCSIVKRQGTVFVICSNDKKHKQRQG